MHYTALHFTSIHVFIHSIQVFWYMVVKFSDTKQVNKLFLNNSTGPVWFWLYCDLKCYEKFSIYISLRFDLINPIW